MAVFWEYARFKHPTHQIRSVHMKRESYWIEYNIITPNFLFFSPNINWEKTVMFWRKVWYKVFIIR